MSLIRRLQEQMSLIRMVFGCGSDEEDVEWRDSVAAIRKVNKEDAESTKKLVENCIRNSVDKEGGVPVLGSGGHTEVYEDSDGDVKTPGESEEDDIVGKMHVVDVPICR
ncbi:hypothetical protein Hanom_Chr03g00231701 [Helianthus anomalus]